jgi:hypothetical protein
MASVGASASRGRAAFLSTRPETTPLVESPLAEIHALGTPSRSQHEGALIGLRVDAAVVITLIVMANAWSHAYQG